MAMSSKIRCVAEATPIIAEEQHGIERVVLCAHADLEAQQFLLQALAPHRIVVAASGRDALRGLNTGIFDAYFMDYWLPDWSGVSLCRQIRRSDPHAPVCFYTNARSDDARKRALRAGADLFLQGTIKENTLRAHLERLLVMNDAASARAQMEADRAIRTELERRAAAAMRVDADRRESAAQAIERSTRAKALKAFVAAGGTLSSFERAWRQAYLRATLNFHIGQDDTRPGATC